MEAKEQFVLSVIGPNLSVKSEDGGSSVGLEEARHHLTILDVDSTSARDRGGAEGRAEQAEQRLQSNTSESNYNLRARRKCI